jgi:hypothetical protein
MAKKIRTDEWKWLKVGAGRSVHMQNDSFHEQCGFDRRNRQL